MPDTTLPRMSALPDDADDLAQLREALGRPSQFGVLPISSHPICKPSKPRKPKKKGCEIVPSAFRPHVLARDRLCHWKAPISNMFHSELVRDFALDNIVQLFNVLLASVELKTRENYGAGLLHFHQFCDSRKIPKSSRMPVSDNLLAPFVASWASKIATTTVENWLAGLHFWHNMHGVPWHRHALLHMSTAGVKKLVPESSKCPHRVPVMLEHMHMLYRNLDLSNTLDVSIFAVASITFWSCCRSAI